MIIRHENIQNITLGVKNKLKYSKEYTFIPLQIYLMKINLQIVFSKLQNYLFPMELKH